MGYTLIHCPAQFFWSTYPSRPKGSTIEKHPMPESCLGAQGFAPWAGGMLFARLPLSHRISLGVYPLRLPRVLALAGINDSILGLTPQSQIVYPVWLQKN